MNKNYFVTAKPVWPDSLKGGMNYMVGFRTVINVQEIAPTFLNITVATLYRVFVNGEFVGYGPARAAKNYFRVDTLELTDKLCKGKNIISIEVAVYNSQTSYIMEQEEFVQAEIVCGDEIIASTEGAGPNFEAHKMDERVQKAPKYSLQRGFVEYYKLSELNQQWKVDSEVKVQRLPLVQVNDKNLLLRSVAYPQYSLVKPKKVIKKTNYIIDENSDSSWRPVFTRMVGRIAKGFMDPELEINPVEIIEKISDTSITKDNELIKDNISFEFKPYMSRTYEFKANLTGFIGMEIEVKENTKVYLVFDEILYKDDVDIKRAQVNTIIGYELEKGIYQLESFEAYTFKYLKIINFEGLCEVKNIYLREYTNPDTQKAQFLSDSQELNDLFKAGIETYRQNALDIFTDCPSRERGGYLCDSYFTARAASYISGNTKVEDNFFENYMIAEAFDKLPEGMIPMCYPADVKANYRDITSPYGMYIPNWSLWFIIQLEDYVKRNTDNTICQDLKSRVLGILDYFETCLNEDGLIEKLPGWVFIEWSKANDYVQDVNYPTNMLYAAALEAVGRIYNLEEYIKKGKKLKEIIREQSFDGKFFVDNALREDGKLKRTNNKTEVCQYYAFFFGVATKDTHAELWNTLVNDFGPERKNTKIHSDVDYANAFIGNFLRLDLISNDGSIKKWLKESTLYFNRMVQETGTLWEHDEETASCNHGFGSYVVYWLYKNILGIRNIDTKNKKITLCFNDININKCEGTIPVLDDSIEMKWWKEKGDLYYEIKVPSGYKLEVENNTSLNIRSMM